MNILMEVPFFIRVYPYLLTVLSIALVALYLVSLLKKLREKRTNDRFPQRSTEAVVSAKSEELSYADPAMNRLHTRYYVTFEDPDGNRTELSVSGKEYGMLAEGDRGQLSLQGTRFLGFERIR